MTDISATMFTSTAFKAQGTITIGDVSSEAFSTNVNGIGSIDLRRVYENFSFNIYKADELTDSLGNLTVRRQDLINSEANSFRVQLGLVEGTPVNNLRRFIDNTAYVVQVRAKRLDTIDNDDDAFAGDLREGLVDTITVPIYNASELALAADGTSGTLGITTSSADDTLRVVLTNNGGTNSTTSEAFNPAAIDSIKVTLSVIETANADGNNHVLQRAQHEFDIDLTQRITENSSDTKAQWVTDKIGDNGLDAKGLSAIALNDNTETYTFEFSTTQQEMKIYQGTGTGSDFDVRNDMFIFVSVNVTSGNESFLIENTFDSAVSLTVPETGNQTNSVSLTFEAGQPSPTVISAIPNEIHLMEQQVKRLDGREHRTLTVIDRQEINGDEINRVVIELESNNSDLGSVFIHLDQAYLTAAKTAKGRAEDDDNRASYEVVIREIFDSSTDSVSQAEENQLELRYTPAGTNLNRVNNYDVIKPTVTDDQPNDVILASDFMHSGWHLYWIAYNNTGPFTSGWREADSRHNAYGIAFTSSFESNVGPYWDKASGAQVTFGRMTGLITRGNFGSAGGDGAKTLNTGSIFAGTPWIDFGIVDHYKTTHQGADDRLALDNEYRARIVALQSGLELLPVESQADGNGEAVWELHLRSLAKLGHDVNGDIAFSNLNRLNDSIEQLQLELAIEDVEALAYQRDLGTEISFTNFMNGSVSTSQYYYSNDLKAVANYGYKVDGVTNYGPVPAQENAPELYNDDGSLKDSVTKLIGDMDRLTFMGTKLTRDELDDITKYGTDNPIVEHRSNHHHQFLSHEKDNAFTGNYNSQNTHLHLATIIIPGYRAVDEDGDVVDDGEDVTDDDGELIGTRITLPALGNVESNIEAALNSFNKRLIKNDAGSNVKDEDGNATEENVTLNSHVIRVSENVVPAIMDGDNVIRAARNGETVYEIFLSVNGVHGHLSDANLIQATYTDNDGASQPITAVADTYPVVTIEIRNTTGTETNHLQFKTTTATINGEEFSVVPGFDVSSNSNKMSRVKLYNNQYYHALQSAGDMAPSVPDTGVALVWETTMKRADTHLLGASSDNIVLPVGAILYLQANILTNYDLGTSDISAPAKRAATVAILPDLDPQALTTVFTTPSTQDITDKKLTFTVTDGTPQIATDGNLVRFVNLKVEVSVTDANSGDVSLYTMTFNKDTDDLGTAHTLTGLTADKQSVDGNNRASFVIELQSGLGAPGSTVTKQVNGENDDDFNGNFTINENDIFTIVSTTLTNVYGEGASTVTATREGVTFHSYRMEGAAVFNTNFTGNTDELNNMLFKSDLLPRLDSNSIMRVETNRKVSVRLSNHANVTSSAAQGYGVYNTKGAQENLTLAFGKVDADDTFTDFDAADFTLFTRDAYATQNGTNSTPSSGIGSSDGLNVPLTENELINNLGGGFHIGFKMTLTTTFLNGGTNTAEFVHKFARPIETNLPAITNMTITNPAQELTAVPAENFTIQCTVTMDKFDGNGVAKQFMPAVTKLNVNLAAVANNEVVLNTSRAANSLNGDDLITPTKALGVDPGQLAVVDLSTLSSLSVDAKSIDISGATGNTINVSFDVPKAYLGTLLLVEATLKSTSSATLSTVNTENVSGDSKYDYNGDYIKSITTGDGAQGFEGADQDTLYALLKAQSNLALVTAPAEMKDVLAIYDTSQDGEYGKTATGDLGFNITSNGFEMFNALAIENEGGNENLTYRDFNYLTGADYATKKLFNNKPSNMNFTNTGLSKAVVLQAHGTVTFTIEGVEVAVNLNNDTLASEIAGLADNAHALKTAADRGQLDLDFVRGCISFMLQGTEAVGIRDTADGDAAVGDITDLNVGADKTLSTALEQDDKLLDLGNNATHGTVIFFNKAIDVTVAAADGAIITEFETYQEAAATNAEENTLGIRVAGVLGAAGIPTSILSLLKTSAQANQANDLISITGVDQTANYGTTDVVISNPQVEATDLLPDSKTSDAITTNT